jgi:translation elongation factor EF-4
VNFCGHNSARRKKTLLEKQKLSKKKMEDHLKNDHPG